MSTYLFHAHLLIEAIFSTSRAYAIAQVVVYSGEYYKIIKAVPSNYTGNPTNTEYFENIKGWTDNAKGATKAFPFEYRSKRKKSGGVWGAFSASTVDGRWVENGSQAKTEMVLPQPISIT